MRKFLIFLLQHIAWKHRFDISNLQRVEKQVDFIIASFVGCLMAMVLGKKLSRHEGSKFQTGK